MNMDFTVLENTQRVQVCMLVMRKQRGKDRMVEREESKQRRAHREEDWSQT